MSTLRVAAINHPSASSGGLAISASGNVTGAGLDLITTQSFSAASSVSLNNCFSATYTNYRVVLNAAPSTGLLVNLRYRASGVDDSTSNYRYSTYYHGPAGTSANYNFGNPGNLATVAIGVGTSITASSFDVYNPQASAWTLHAGHGVFDVNGFTLYNQFNQTTSFDGFSLLTSTGTITGTLRVYGYRN